MYTRLRAHYTAHEPGGHAKLTEQDILKILGANIRELRSQIEISQELFALIAGLDRTYLGGVERGKRNISVKNIVKIAKAFEISPGELFKGII